MSNNNKKKNESQEQPRDDVSDLDKAFRKGKQGNKRREEKRYIRDVKEGEYGGEFIDNFEKW